MINVWLLLNNGYLMVAHDGQSWLVINYLPSKIWLMVGCEHIVLMVVLMTIKDRFASYCCETLTILTTSQRGQWLDTLCSKAHCGVPDCEAARSAWCLWLLRGWLWSRKGALLWVELCEGSCQNYTNGDILWSCVLWVNLYTSGYSKTIRIAIPTVMGGVSNIFRD